ncbi:hypothetical protein DSM43276_02233 [Mycobacteroides salmoniphilum]|nr:hypothetical protein DSM43276_02233 [Mycobacteroides salmoniphilum]
MNEQALLVPRAAVLSDMHVGLCEPSCEQRSAMDSFGPSYDDSGRRILALPNSNGGTHSSAWMLIGCRHVLVVHR